MKKEYIQSFIVNVSTCTSLDELAQQSYGLGTTLVETILDTAEPIEWTVPKWAKPGDVVFFMHSKKAITHVNQLNSDLYKTVLSENNPYGPADVFEMKDYLDRCNYLYQLYGGKVFAVGIVSGIPFYEAPIEGNVIHWKSRTYAAIDDINILENPIDREKFTDFIQITRQGTITPVYGKEYESLMKLVTEFNALPEKYKYRVALPKELAERDGNDWLSLAKKHNFRYQTEEQFRSLFVNPFLGSLASTGPIYRECPCKRNDLIHPSYVDNVINFSKKCLCVEVKQDIYAEKDLPGQCHKYTHLSTCTLSKSRNYVITAESMYCDHVLVIDTEGLYLYTDSTGEIRDVIKLKELSSLKKVRELKSNLLCLLTAENAHVR